MCGLQRRQRILAHATRGGRASIESELVDVADEGSSGDSGIEELVQQRRATLSQRHVAEGKAPTMSARMTRSQQWAHRREREQQAQREQKARERKELLARAKHALHPRQNRMTIDNAQ